MGGEFGHKSWMRLSEEETFETLTVSSLVRYVNNSITTEWGKGYINFVWNSDDGIWMLELMKSGEPRITLRLQKNNIASIPNTVTALHQNGFLYITCKYNSSTVFAKSHVKKDYDEIVNAFYLVKDIYDGKYEKYRDQCSTLPKPKGISMYNRFENKYLRNNTYRNGDKHYNSRYSPASYRANGDDSKRQKLDSSYSKSPTGNGHFELRSPPPSKDFSPYKPLTPNKKNLVNGDHAKKEEQDSHSSHKVIPGQIVRMAVTDRSVTSRIVAQHIQSVTHHSVSARTIRRRLQRSGLSARRTLLRLPLTQNHRRFRRQWCDERRMWTAEWNEIVFTDESRFCLQHHDGRIRIWRHRGETILNSSVMQRHTGPAPGIMVWGGIGYHSFTPLVHIAVTLNSQLCISEVLEPVVLPYPQGLPTAILLPWLARSPDFSQIENMWSMVSQRLTQITSPAATPDQLWQRVEAAWSAFEDAEQQALLDEDSTQTQEKLAKQLQVSQGAVSLRLNSLRMTQKLSRWVPHELSERQQERRLVTCEGLLARHEKKSFLHRIVTSGEKSIHFSNPMRQRSWGLLGQFLKQKPRPNRLGKKAMLCVWWDQTGVIYFKLLKPGETVNTSRYEQQMHSLREALNEIRPELREKHNKLILQHDNAPAHNATVVKNTIKDLGWELLPLPPYSPDLAPSDYHLFTSLGHALKNQEFSNSDILRKWLVDWFDSKGIEFFRQGIRKLPERWSKCIANQGNYFE
ncbi:hypothetical protein LAZ67_11002704 [Cordylochernes scorpioides]|uniref:Transposase Tc1-like domain-containing protein n=1 Tax=Cordylochernes scorpioides TaxID=51811 RepID=A0ABY6KZE0_9ARAC|nr:hypothetical protein LAZ67_11002704 [Cordylochernes scorpioides]